MREQTMTEQSAAQIVWENQLDDMGTEASIYRLERHARRAPDPQSETAQYLRGQIAARRSEARRLAS